MIASISAVVDVEGVPVDATEWNELFVVCCSPPTLWLKMVDGLGCSIQLVVETISDCKLVGCKLPPIAQLVWTGEDWSAISKTGSDDTGGRVKPVGFG